MHNPAELRRRVLPLLLVALLLGGGYWWWRNHRQAQLDSTQLTANGTVQADVVEVGAQRAARLARFTVPEGAAVKAGQIIAELDTSELAAQLQQAQGAAQGASGRLAEILKGARPEELQKAEGQALSARAALRGAQRLLGVSRLAYERRTSLKQAVDAAQTQVRVAEAAVKQALSAEGGAAKAVQTAREESRTTVQLRQARDQARQQLETAEAALTSARAQHRLVVLGPREEDRRAAEAQVGQAEAALQAARTTSGNAARDLARAEEMSKGSAVSPQQLDAAQARATATAAQARQAEQALSQAQQRLAALRSGSRPEEVQAAEGAEAQAQAAVDGARRAVANAEEAYALKLASRAQLDTALTQHDVTRTQVLGTQSTLAGARLALANARTAYSDALAERQGQDTAQQQYEAAIGQLQAAEAQLSQAKNGYTREQKVQAKAQLQQASGLLKLARVQEEQSVIRAPSAGVLTEYVARPGEVVVPGATVAKLVPLDAPYITLYAPLTELGRVRIGQVVDVTTDTFPGKSYEGKVYWISDTPEFTPRNVQTKDERVKLVFQVKVRIRNPRRELKPGMPADATVRLT
ncbi:MAG TPA: HlyD family efflux transporter periplasmic adaptor subunit [Armatimonadota bacterium]